MNDENLAPLLERLDTLMAEIRRQGRASIAAQAAAESCASAVDALRDSVQSADKAAPAGQPDDAERLVRALMPVIDAVERMGSQARRLAGSLRPPGRLARMLGVPDAAPGVTALADGVAVLASQLDQALGDAGVELDRGVGGPVDGEAHRVVETRAPGSGAQAGTIIEIVRPGIWYRGRCLREADVVAARGTPALP